MKKTPPSLLLVLVLSAAQGCSLVTPAGGSLSSPAPSLIPAGHETPPAHAAGLQAGRAPEDSPVYLPGGDFVLRIFFELISSGRAAEAVAMLDKSSFSDAAARQVWSEDFKSITALEIESLQPWEPGSWKEDRQIYRLVFNVQLKPGQASPGWENGQNTRWVTLTRDPLLKLWQIYAIATGP